MSENTATFRVGDRVQINDNLIYGGSYAFVTARKRERDAWLYTLRIETEEPVSTLAAARWRGHMLTPAASASSENPKAAFGNLKTPTLSVIPSPPLLQVGEVMRRGAEKYGAYNWRESRVSTSTYLDAAMRHLMSYQDGETLDPDDNQSHLAHAAASLFVIMDALAVGNATDDRPKPGVAAEFIAATAANRSK